ncbi:hypothetical protein L6258_02330 [Candidatus Parcubacteria bacterium]|nr:hypothetical protein [Candidatus Parcubacteria bacterium]
MNDTAMNTGAVETIKVVAINVGNWIRKETGLIPATAQGRTLEKLFKADALGILRENPNSQPKKQWWDWLGLFTTPPKRLWVGTVYFNDPERGADEWHRWVLEAYGREYFYLIEELAYRMAAAFGVEVIISLVHEQVQTEPGPRVIY